MESFGEPGKIKQLMNSRETIRLFFAGFLAFVGYFLQGSNPSLSLILILLSVTINGIPIIIGAIKGLLEKRANVDELVSIAIIASLFSDHYFEAAIVSFIMVLGALIEEATSKSARKKIESLISATPKTATVVLDDKEEIRPIEEVKVNDILLVKPGDTIPVDGIIIDGMTSIDESSITGESIPSEKQINDEIYAGTLNHNGVIKLKATKVGEDTTLGKVITLVSDAEKHKPESISLINRYARWFTPFILTCAATTWFLTQNIHRTITVLIVGCPCALILAAPTAIVASIGRAAKEGILIKGGNYLEKSGEATIIFFDKTGTLTEGNPKVDKIITVSDEINKDYVLKMAASIEKDSTHPLAKAIINAAKEKHIEFEKANDAYAEIGLGVRGIINGKKISVGTPYLSCSSTSDLPVSLQESFQEIISNGSTPLFVFSDNEPIGIISVTDKIRPNASETISKLKSLNINNIEILSGDHEKSVKLIASKTGIDNAQFCLKPDNKPSIIKENQKKGNKTIYIGDGINDAPALAISDVGIAMAKRGTEVALEAADIALMHDDISKIPFLINLSRRTTHIIKFNIVFGLLFNLFSILLSGGGYLSPIQGAVAHNVGSVFVVLVSASLGFYSETS